MQLIINAGSSSLKAQLFDNQGNLLHSALVEKIGQKESIYKFDKQENKIKNVKDHKKALHLLITSLNDAGIDLNKIENIVHRVVHGGEKYHKITFVNKKVEKDIEKLSSLAPLHNPVNLAVIRLTKELFRKAKNWAVFDTAFYYSLEEDKYIYAIPYEFYTKYKIRRYGFHGISHQYILEETAKYLKKKINKTNIISCHLGSGASITAIENGKAFDTSLGFTPLEGLVMRSRSGDLDPGVVIYLIKDLGYSAEEVDNILNKKSGFYGISSFADMREILYVLDLYKDENLKIRKCAKNKKMAQLALDIFINRIVKYIGAYYLEMKNVDAIVLTAGIGERSKVIYKIIQKRLKKILKDSNIQLLQIPTNEEFMMYKLLMEELNV